MQDIQYKFLQVLGKHREEGLVTMTQILVCGLDCEGKASMYQFDPRGVYTILHDSPSYSCFGSGVDTGGSMIIKRFWKQNSSPDWALTISAYTMNEVSQIDPTVGQFGGSSYYFRLINGIPIFGSLTDEAHTNTIEKIATRASVLKQTWLYCDIYGEESILAYLDAYQESLISETELIEEDEKDSENKE